MQVTRVGLGSFAIGGPKWSHGWGAQDDDASIATIRHAVEQGVNWIDTAAVYGYGHAERVVARAVNGFAAADRPLLFTKCAVVWNEDGTEESRIASPTSLRRELEDSLRRLDVDAVDLYQVHWPPLDGTRIDEYWQVLLEMKQSGKVRAIGLSNHDRGELETAESLGHVDSLQPPLSALRRDAAADVIPWCHEHDVAVIVYSPMQSGLLTGAFDERRAAQLPDTDWRSRHADFRGEQLRANLSVADAMGKIAAEVGVSTGAVAVAWTLAVPGVTAAIVGARTPLQVDNWLAAGELQLSAAHLNAIADTIEATGAGTGPARAGTPTGKDLR
jgi:aryl-alcohol dehydrogenase-like predicted oxidoreductase